jgi:hypothetical protein
VTGRRKMIDYTGRFQRNVANQNYIKGGKGTFYADPTESEG